jgi:arabinogalactan oligomer/maltooligosaccharide transport system substrate-binding protein
MRKSIRSSVLTFLPCCLLLVACRPADRAPSALNIWLDSNEKEMKFFKAVARSFESQNPQIKVKLRFMPFSDLKPRYSGEAREPGAPELIYLMNDWVGELAQQKLLKPLNQNLDQFVPFSREGLSYQGQIYAMPFVFQVAALIRNTRLIPKPSSNWKTFTKKSGHYPLMYDNRNFYFHALFFHAFGGTLFDAKGQLALRREPLLASIRFALALEKNGGVPPKSSASATLNLFSAGQTAQIISGPWSLAAPLQNRVPLAVSTLPPISATQVPRPFIGIKGFGLNPWGKASEAAEKWLAFVAQQEVQALALRELDNLPVLASLYQNHSLAEHQRQFYQQAQTGVPMPNSPLMKYVWQEMNWLLAQAFESPEKLEELTDQALKRLYKEAHQSADLAA